MTDSRIEALRNLAEAAPPSSTPAEGAPVRPTVKVGPQRLTGIDLIENIAIVGNGEKFVGSPLTAQEVKAITKIGHRAYRRAMLAHLDSVETASPTKRKRGRPASPSGKKRGRPAKTKAANGEAPRKRGRPPKNRTVTFEAPPEAPAVDPTVAEAQ